MRNSIKHGIGAIFTALILLAPMAATSAAAETLRIGTEGAYPPFNYIDSSGKIKGFDVDIGLALCKQMGVTCTVVAQDWDGIIPGLLANKYDLIIASMYITKEREKRVSFTDPYYLAAMTMVAPKDTKVTKFTNETMKGKIIGAQSGTTQSDYIEAMFPDADIRLYPTQDGVNLDMASGRIDFEAGDMIPMLDWTTKTKDGACCKLVGKPITDPKFVGTGAGIAVRKEDNKLRERLNKALAEIRANGTYKRINDKYFTVDIYTMK